MLSCRQPLPGLPAPAFLRTTTGHRASQKERVGGLTFCRSLSPRSPDLPPSLISPPPSPPWPATFCCRRPSRTCSAVTSPCLGPWRATWLRIPCLGTSMDAGTWRAAYRHDRALPFLHPLSAAVSEPAVLAGKRSSFCGPKSRRFLVSVLLSSLVVQHEQSKEFASPRPRRRAPRLGCPSPTAHQESSQRQDGASQQRTTLRRPDQPMAERQRTPSRRSRRSAPGCRRVTRALRARAQLHGVKPLAPTCRHA